MAPRHDDLQGKSVVVTGGSRGIGRAAALCLAERGARIGLIQRGDAQDVISEIEALGTTAVQVRCDLSDSDGAEHALGAITGLLGGLDAVVCNAGAIVRQPALELSLESWRAIIELNLTSVFAMARAAGRQFVADQTAGSIVVIASVLAMQGGLNVSAYAASKGGVIQLARALANEWGAYGIRVNAVAPGYIETEMTRALRDDASRYGQLLSRIPLGRFGTEREVAEAVSFLASPASGYVHGHVLAVDGGWLSN